VTELGWFWARGADPLAWYQKRKRLLIGKMLNIDLLLTVAASAPGGANPLEKNAYKSSGPDTLRRALGESRRSKRLSRGTRTWQPNS